MPYKRVGNKIYVRRGRRWVLKQKCKNAESAKKALRLLHRELKEEKRK
ncbi:MAG: hypothetical protein H0Z28_11075 [Archaeoglobus sp.]|nr:hypothetical protein [Archaeoglobus sp.]